MYCLINKMEKRILVIITVLLLVVILFFAGNYIRNKVNDNYTQEVIQIEEANEHEETVYVTKYAYLYGGDSGHIQDRIVQEYLFDENCIRYICYFNGVLLRSNTYKNNEYDDILQEIESICEEYRNITAKYCYGTDGKLENVTVTEYINID